ncbi:hypothetical protein, partial [Klebsiella pneumoniae]|uniref:hypothetical protein n=1 Tax=Klebsiella pneumoniae TaxID=573 RepID=UPI001952B8C6
ARYFLSAHRWRSGRIDLFTLTGKSNPSGCPPFDATERHVSAAIASSWKPRPKKRNGNMSTGEKRECS